MWKRSTHPFPFFSSHITGSRQAHWLTSGENMGKTRGSEPRRWELRHTEQGPPLGLHCNSVSSWVDIAIYFTANTIHSSMYPSIHQSNHSYLSLGWLKKWSLDSRTSTDLLTGSSHKARLTQSMYELMFYCSAANTFSPTSFIKM